jgi:hypothetical protein
VENGSALDECVIVDSPGMELRLEMPGGAVIRAWTRPCHWHLTPSGDKWARCGDHALPCFQSAAAQARPCLIPPLPTFFHPRPPTSTHVHIDALAAVHAAVHAATHPHGRLTVKSQIDTVRDYQTVIG